MNASNAEDYINGLPAERKQIINALRNVIKENLPPGFSEEMSSGMIGYVVPHAIYPAGYHVNARQPLPFMYIASQKNFVAVYHLGLYADPELLAWFKTTYHQESSVKLDMGKSCIRFKKPEQIPLKLIGELAARLSPAAWISLYESGVKK